MGGFAFEYVVGTEQLIVTQAISDNFAQAFHRIDDNRQMLVWHDFNSVGPQLAHAVIVDVSAAPALTVGPIADFVHTAGGADACTPVQLTGDRWLMHFQQGGAFDVPYYMRFTVSALAITITDGDEQSFQAEWAPGDAAVPDAIFEGHTVGPYNVFYFLHGDGSWSGIDDTHIMAPAVLQWGAGNFDSKYAIVDLTTNAVTYSFSGADLGFLQAPDLSGLQQSAWEPGPGSSYRWVFSFDNSVFMLVKLALTASTVSGTIIISSSDDPDLQIVPMGRALDGKLWIAPDAATLIEHHTWTYADPTVSTYAAFSINNTAITKHFYTAESRGLNFSTNRPVPAGADLIVSDSSSIHPNDTHVRNEGRILLIGAPHGDLTALPTAIGGTPVDGYVILAQTVGILDISLRHLASPFSIYLSVSKEVVQRPFAEFSYSVPSSPVPTAPWAVAFDATESIDDTRDSYWHPITDYYWQFDDGQIAHVTVPTTDHTYRIGSIGRHDGDGWDVQYPVDISLTLPPHGTLDRFNPLLVVGSSAGYSDPAWHNTFKLNPSVPLTGGPADSGVRYY